MEKGNGESKLDKKLSFKLSDAGKETKQQLINTIEEVDKITESPSSRAVKVLDILQAHGKDQLTNWDIVCFCAEYLGSQIYAFPWLEEFAKRLVRLVYTQHYIMRNR